MGHRLLSILTLGSQQTNQGNEFGVIFLKMGQTRPLFQFIFVLFLNTMTNIVESLTINGIAIEGMHGIEPGTSGWQALTNPLSYGVPLGLISLVKFRQECAIKIGLVKQARTIQFCIFTAPITEVCHFYCLEIVPTHV